MNESPTTYDTASFNPMSDEVMADPSAHFEEMRARCPVHHVANVSTPFWMLFRHEDIRNAMLRPDVWSSRYGVTPVYQKQIALFADGADHTVFRDVFKARLMPPALKRLEPQVRRLASEQLDSMMKKGPEIDLHDDFALPLPVHVVSLLLGIPGEDDAQLKHFSDAMIDAGFGKDNSEYLQLYQSASAFFEKHLAAREATLSKAGVTEPELHHVGSVISDDWVSDMICARVNGRHLTRPEQYILLIGLLIGGNETTTSLITNLMWRLLEVPERWAAVRAEPGRLIPLAIEESLRFDSPTQGMFRTSLCPVELHGKTIPMKSKLMVAYGAANRDPDVFAAPNQFRLDRPREEVSKHLAFGVGPHSCPGAALSRMETKIVMELFVERLPKLRLGGPTERNVGYNFWGRGKLPLIVG